MAFVAQPNKTGGYLTMVTVRNQALVAGPESVVQFAAAALYERRKPVRLKTAVIDRRYNKIKLHHYQIRTQRGAGGPGLAKLDAGRFEIPRKVLA